PARRSRSASRESSLQSGACQADEPARSSPARRCEADLAPTDSTALDGAAALVPEPEPEPRGAGGMARTKIAAPAAASATTPPATTSGRFPRPVAGEGPPEGECRCRCEPISHALRDELLDADGALLVVRLFGERAVGVERQLVDEHSLVEERHEDR